MQKYIGAIIITASAKLGYEQQAKTTHVLPLEVSLLSCKVGFSLVCLGQYLKRKRMSVLQTVERVTAKVVAIGKHRKADNYIVYTPTYRFRLCDGRELEKFYPTPLMKDSNWGKKKAFFSVR